MNDMNDMDRRHACALDAAQDEADAAVASGVAQSRARWAAVAGAPRQDGSCGDCGEEIEPGRARLGLGRCLLCAQALESRARR